MNTSVVTSEPERFPPVARFDDMELSEKLLRGIYAYGYEKPSTIQSVGITPIIAGRDIIGQAQSGTGKTATFLIGALQRIDPALKKTQVVVVCHTHELADQTTKVARTIGSYLKTSVCYAVGGEPRHINARDCRNGVQIVVGTPGRIWDLASSGELSFADLRLFVVDEADEMLRDKFADQVGEIVKIGFPPTCRIAFFSATLTPEVKALAAEILTDPVRIFVPEAEVKPGAIRQFYVEVEDDRWKVDLCCQIYDSMTIDSSIIFVNSKERADRLYHALTENGFPCSVIYGDMPQATRKQRMEDFRNSKTRVLIATNILARGIDVPQVSVVFNFDMPPYEDKENYIHRIGRCGRFGKIGAAIALTNAAEKEVLDRISEHYSFRPRPLPQDLKGVLDD